MKKLIVTMAVGAAALLSASAAIAADTTVKPKVATNVTQSSTDFSAQRRHRHYRHYGHRYYRHYGYRHYRPYYRNYGYAPGYYGGGYGGPYYGGYGYGGPSITFGFGGYRGW